jgi:hypothetical protein
MLARLDRWHESVKQIFRLLLLLALAAFAVGCAGVSSRPFDIHSVSLSTLSQTTIVVDRSRYQGIHLIVTNDLPSDVFLKIEPQYYLLSAPEETQSPFRLRDLDEIYRTSRGLTTADLFMYVWSGNKGFFHHVFDPRLRPGKDYFLPITYYHCKDAGFYTRSLKIVIANKAVQ